MAIAVTLSSCLITQPVHFDEPANSPPAIDTDGAMLPLNAIVRLPPTTSVADAGIGSATSATFQFNVFDADVDQVLQFKVLLDQDTTATIERSIPASSAGTGRERRTASFDINFSQFPSSPGCHRVQLFVSSGFDFGTVQPVLDHDVASATWWIEWHGTIPGSSVDMGTCRP